MTIIRTEQERDYKRVEEITRLAFWNLYVPGCCEHYLAHILRGHPDFVPELDLVVEVDGEVIGNIMYTRTRLVSDSGEEKHILTFGPVCMVPHCQRQGYGKLLMEHSFKLAAGLGYEAIVIFGNPGNYVGRGFKSCRKYNVRADNGTYPAAMMVKELVPGSLDGRKWTYHESPAFEIDEEKAQAFGGEPGPLERKTLPCQEEFYILSQAVLL